MQNTEKHDGGPSTVVYKNPAEAGIFYELTYNVPATVARLESLGFVIIDIVDGA